MREEGIRPCPSFSFNRIYNSLLLTTGTPRRSLGRVGNNCRAPWRTLGRRGNSHRRDPLKGTHRNLKNRSFYLSLHSDLWDGRMADFLLSSRRVHVPKVLRVSELLASWSSLSLFGTLASFNTHKPSSASNFLPVSFLTFFSLPLPTGVVAPIFLNHPFLNWHTYEGTND